MASKFQLDPNNSISGPQLSWANFLKNFKSHELKMIPNQKVYDILKNTLYGGKVEVLRKHAKVNSDQELILGLDFSNMYGHSQCLPLPYGRHEI